MKIKSDSFLKTILLKWSVFWTILLGSLSLVGFYLGSGLELKLSLTDLLPDKHPSVVKLDKITEMVGGVGYLIVVLDAKDAKSHLDAVPKIKEQLEQRSDLIRSAFIDREEYFFASRMLYYLKLDDLKELEKTIRKQILESRSKIVNLGLWDNGPKKKSKEIDPEVKKTAKRSADVLPYLTSKDKEHLLIMIKPTFDSVDFKKSTALIDYTKKVLDENLPSSVSYELAGRYFNKIHDSKVIQGDIAVLGLIAISIIGLILFVYLRSFRALFVIFLPVLMGVGLTVGFARIFIGHINIITGFLVGILSGLGVDYGIHLALRVRLEYKEPSSSDPDPIWRTLASSGHSVFVGALSAALAFYFLCFSSFRAFSEFGFVCGTGIMTVLFCLLLCFSALARWFHLDTAKYAERVSVWGTLPVLNGRRALIFALLLTLVVGLAGSLVNFEYDFDKMLQHSKKVQFLNSLVDDIYERSVTPSVFAASNKDEAVKLEDLLKDKYMPDTLNMIVSGATIVPDDQIEKQKLLKKIELKISKFKDKWLEDALDIPAVTIRRWVDATPFSFEDLPVHLRDGLRGTNQANFLLYIYPAVKLSTAHGVRTYAAMVKDVESQFPDVLTGSDAVVFSEILDLINHDGLMILGVIFLAVGFFIWLNMRTWNDTLTTYLPLLFSLPIGMGLMALLDIKFNIFNISIVPSFVAMGIDVPIHIIHRAKEVRSGFKAARDLSASIHLALLTAGVGFGILVFSRAGVLRSLGWIALLGTVAIWWLGLFILPALLEVYYRRSSRRETEGDGILSSAYNAGSIKLESRKPPSDLRV